MTRTATFRSGVFLAGFLLLLALTNPGQKRFDAFVSEHVARAQSKHSIGRALMNAVGPTVVDAMSTRKNFLLFSVYRLQSPVGHNVRTFLGIVGLILPIP
jgi:hypothetical protein